MSHVDAIVAELISTGLSPHQLTILVRLMAAMSTPLSGGIRVESPEGAAAEKRRAWDREYRRRRKANADSTRIHPTFHPNPPEIHPSESCNLLSSSLSKDGIQEVKKEPKSESKALAKKGSRLSSAATLSNEDREFAFQLGFDNAHIDQMWAEFVDYWSAVPGHRGIKLSWSATWRNRVRTLAERKPRGFSGNSPRPGSREDRQEKTYNAYQKLREYARSGSDDQGQGGHAGDAATGIVPFAKLARS